MLYKLKSSVFQMKITRSLKAFMGGIIDYAGLFPPSKLELEEAFGNYVKYKNGSLSEMISGFICPVKLLKQLEIIILKNYRDENKINVTVLGRGGYDRDNFLQVLEEDLNYWSDFLLNTENKVITESFEIKLPDELITAHDSKKLSVFINEISAKIKNRINQDVFIFFEGHIGTKWKKNIKHFIEAVKIHNESENNCGYKLRTGGTEIDFFPEPEVIAYSIRECLDRNIRMKCTAGLHHPFRHYDINIGVKMHGFINVFGAGIIAMRHNISDSGLKEIIDDENPDNFVFTDECFSWKDWKISPEEIDFARKNLMISFGSCSFDEPLEDLVELNLLQ